MKAQEAKQIALEARDIPIENILKKIKFAAISGDLTVSHSLDDKEKKLFSEIKSKLETLGYDIKRYSSYNQRDEYDYITISWY